MLTLCKCAAIAADYYISGRITLPVWFCQAVLVLNVKVMWLADVQQAVLAGVVDVSARRAPKRAQRSTG